MPKLPEPNRRTVARLVDSLRHDDNWRAYAIGRISDLTGIPAEALPAIIAADGTVEDVISRMESTEPQRELTP